ncbi:MAG: glycosyltransferase family 4 protein [Spirochaetia bacterium]|jgi:glycosyltransferase involved in cell wall biosynthesis|nr:glycosyltransferase family 4 protein [Spirochaetia bacterium]
MSRAGEKFLFITPQVVYPQTDGGKKSTLGRIMRLHSSGSKVYVASFNVTGQTEQASVDFFKRHGIHYTVLTTRLARRRKNKLFFIIDYCLGMISSKPRFAQNHIDRECSAVISKIISQNNISNVYFDSLWTAESVDFRNIRNPFLVEHNIEHIFLKETAKCESNVIVKILTYFESFRAKFYEKNILCKMPSIIFLSGYDRDFAADKFCIDKNKCRVDKNILFMENKIKYSGKGNYILFTGSLNFQPNLEGIEWFLLNCFAGILKKHSELKLIITGPVKDKIKKHVLKHKNVEFTGLISNAEMAKLMSGCRCIISPILSGSGIKIKNIEALAVGIPIVMTNFSHRGIKNSGHSGFCKTDSAQEFTNAILEILG